jgi:hypothetical protein
VNLDELHDELVRMGRRPVPAPRPEFVRSLLDRIELDEDLPTPVPIQMARRDPWARFRMVAVGAVAAAMLTAVGLVSVFRQGDGKAITISAARVSETRSEAPPKEIKVGDDASVTTEDGSYTAECPSEGAKIPTTKGVYVCHLGETVLIVILGGHITEASVDGAAASDAPASTTTVAPGPSVTTSPSTTVTTTRGPSASVVTTTTKPGTPSTTSTSAATPPPVGGGSTPEQPSPSFKLRFTTPDAGSVTLAWDAYPGSDFARYVVLRTSSMSELIDTPTYTPDNPGNKVGELAPVTNTNFTDRFDALVPGTQKVAYRVAVLDAAGNMVALSSTTTLDLEWTMGPSEVPTTSTTTPASTTTTTSTVPDGSPATTAPTTPTTTK